MELRLNWAGLNKYIIPLCFVRIDKEAEPGLDAVHEASRDLVAVGYDPAHVAPVAAVIFANLLEVR